MNTFVYNYFGLILLTCMFFGCRTDHMPKPKGYNRITLPPPGYQALGDSFPYSFEYSKEAKVSLKTISPRLRGLECKVRMKLINHIPRPLDGLNKFNE